MIGHAGIRRRLREAVERDGLHHALMFEGPRGVGKRLLADELARLANCTAPVDRRPCPPGRDRCPTCVAIANGVHPDVIVLEPDRDKAARTIPIEAIRETIRQAQYHRYGARARFVIVDPAEAMLEPAANALLKTLEEPPVGTHFVLITHNPRALLPTIRSRCQRIRFGAVAATEIEAWLAARDVPADRAAAAARLALGCPGRAAGLADGGLDTRAELRSELIRTLDAPLADVYQFSATVTQGARQDWAEQVEAVIELIEDLARDASIRATGASVPALDGDPASAAIVDRLAQTWPHGITACARAVQDARDDLEVYVSGKTVVDALITAVRREIPGPA
ncbi:MAG: DNA polymerase III subunit delta' [Myxococcota bacterium]